MPENTGKQLDSVIVALAGPYHYERMVAPFLNAVVEDQMAVSRIGAGSVFWDAIRFTQGEQKLHILIKLGPRHADQLIRLVPKTRMGFVIMVDSSMAETFREAKSVLETIRLNGLSFVMAGMRQEHPDAWGIEDMRRAFRLSDREQLLPCETSMSQQARLILQRIVDLIENRPRA
jgi:hypothetical protein